MKSTDIVRDIAYTSYSPIAGLSIAKDIATGYVTDVTISSRVECSRIYSCTEGRLTFLGSVG